MLAVASSASSARSEWCRQFFDVNLADLAILTACATWVRRGVGAIIQVIQVTKITKTAGPLPQVVPGVKWCKQSRLAGLRVQPWSLIRSRLPARSSSRSASNASGSST